jgi:hypothetical protein
MPKEKQAPANPFEWRRYVVEEDARRGIVAKPTHPQRTRRRSQEPIKSVEDTRLQPRAFLVYNKVKKDEGK